MRLVSWYIVFQMFDTSNCFVVSKNSTFPCKIFRSNFRSLWRSKGFHTLWKWIQNQNFVCQLRTDDQVCPGVAISTRACLSKSSDIKVKWNCNGYASCHLRASSQIFGDPCANFSKYLEVKYNCVSNFHLKGICHFKNYRCIWKPYPFFIISLLSTYASLKY